MTRCNQQSSCKHVGSELITCAARAARDPESTQCIRLMSLAAFTLIGAATRLSSPTMANIHATNKSAPRSAPDNVLECMPGAAAHTLEQPEALI